jgi:hypothetical protein
MDEARVQHVKQNKQDSETNKFHPFLNFSNTGVSTQGLYLKPFVMGFWR